MLYIHLACICVCGCVCVYTNLSIICILPQSQTTTFRPAGASVMLHIHLVCICVYTCVCMYVRLSISCTSLPPSLPSSLPPSQPLSPSLLSFCNRTCSWKSISDFSKQSNFSPPSIPGYSQPVCVRAYVCCVMRVRLRGRACARMWDMCTHADRQRRGTPLARSTHLR